MKIALLGYGKMGKTIEEIVSKMPGISIALKVNSENASKIKKEDLQKVDVAIEFSSPDFVVNNIIKCFNADVPVVVGTTGWYDQLEVIKKQCLSQNQSLLYASNFSVGVNLFYQINKKLAALMTSFPEYKIRIEETHHINKKDAPSGTAIEIAKQIIKANKNYTNWDLDEYEAKNTIPIKAFRKKDNKGAHKVIYKSNIDQITIKHSAKKRDGFAIGAIKAATWLIDKKGVFTFDDVMEI